MNREDEVARRLVRARGRVPQRTMARRIGISRSALSMYEIGQRTPPDDLKVRIAQAYGQSILTLFFPEVEESVCPHGNSFQALAGKKRQPVPMTMEEICKKLGYDVAIIKEENE